MEARVTALETVIPTLATKADMNAMEGKLSLEIEKVRTEIHQSTSQMIKWVAGTGIAVASILISAFIALFSKIDQPQPQQAAPIIIQVPAYQPPAPPPQAPAQH